MLVCCVYFFFFNDTAPTEIYTLSLHDALPICRPGVLAARTRALCPQPQAALAAPKRGRGRDRKSTRLNSSHSQISYAVFCLKKKNNIQAYDKINRQPPLYTLPVYFKSVLSFCI